MTYAKLKELVPEAFRRYSGVKPETFNAMLEVLQQAEGRKKRAGRLASSVWQINYSWP